jgi:DNA primase
MDFAHLDARELAVPFESSLDTKELVKQAVDIVELVGKHIQLRRQGRNYVGLCPWHEDSRPSLQVNPERQSFKCWVCDVGGDVFSFVMKIEGVEFREALAMLADQAGIAVQSLRRRKTGLEEGSAGFVEAGQVFVPGAEAGQVVASAEGKRPLYRAMAWAEEQYHKCLLNSPEAEPARKYLDERGIAPESIQKFHVGFSPNRGDWLQSLVQGNATRLKTLETIGLLARSAEGDRLYDRFRSRLLFSIRDVQDRPVGLGGRVIPGLSDSSPAKYINSPETPLFSKSKLLYGHDLARRAMRKTGRALVMEGYTDCIIAHQHGFEDAVAVLGTALGPRHVQILKRFADRIVLVLDGDEAGQRRANEVLELFVSENVDLRILTLPEGSDPCDFLQEHGAEAFDDLVNTRAVDALEHAFQAATRGVDVEGDVHYASQALERMVSIVAKAPRLRADSTRDDRFRQEKILQRLAASFRVPEEEVRRRLTTLRRAAQRRPLARSHDEIPHDLIGDEPGSESGAGIETSAPGGQIDPWQRELLEILVAHPGCLPAARGVVTSEWLPYPPCRRIYEAFCRLVDAGDEPEFDRLMLEFDDPATKSLLVELDEKGRAKGLTDPEGVLTELMGSFRRREAERKRPVVTGALRQRRFDDQEELNVLRKIREEEQARHGISDPTDG